MTTSPLGDIPAHYSDNVDLGELDVVLSVRSHQILVTFQCAGEHGKCSNRVGRVWSTARGPLASFGVVLGPLPPLKHKVTELPDDFIEPMYDWVLRDGTHVGYHDLWCLRHGRRAVDFDDVRAATERALSGNREVLPCHHSANE